MASRDACLFRTFNGPALPRWPLRYAARYILVTYASFLFVGLATLSKRIA
ncbi:hypothetical protein [Burkholderia ubonensis]|nr:hypothetical protein [Burkholderia ubonensis]